MLNELLISAAFLGGNTIHDEGNTFHDEFNELTCQNPYDGIESCYQVFHQRGNDDSSVSYGSAYLNQQERDYLFKSWHLAINKMNYLMDNAQYEADRICDVSIRNATVGVISGTIAAIPSKNLYAIAIGGCLGGLSHIAGDSYIHFCKSKDYVSQAEFYAKVADEIQEQLWRG